MIDESCLTALNNEEEDAVDALSQLAFHRKKSRNIVIAKKKVLEQLMHVEEFSEMERTVYKTIFNKSVENKIYLHAVSQYILIVPEITGERIQKKQLTDNIQQTIYQITLTELAKSDITDRVNLLTENIEDSEFYKILGKFYGKTCNIKNCTLDFEKRMGGGSTIVKVFEDILKERQKACLCIVDSDQKFFNPSNPVIGNTMSNLKKIIDGKNEELWWKVLFLEVHEIENLIPIQWMEELTKDIQDAEQGISFLKYLSTLEDEPSPVFFFDIKKGIKAEIFHCSDVNDKDKMKHFQKNELFREYWKKYIDDFGIDIDVIHEGTVIHGICKDILVRVNENKNTLNNLYEIEEYLRKNWMLIGRVVFSWTCVGNRIN